MDASEKPLISDAVMQDHRELEEYYKNITSLQDHDELARYQNIFTWELARHSVGEELVLYPAMEKLLPNGSELTQKDRAEHQKAKEQLYKFQSLATNSDSFLPTIKALYEDLAQHIENEESKDLKQLEERLSGDESRKLARDFERTKKFVPTRSHPSAPDRPPFETIVGLLTAPIDKLMDAFRKFPAE
jgi:hemerythrin-like domain-containing protein